MAQKGPIMRPRTALISRLSAAAGRRRQAGTPTKAPDPADAAPQRPPTARSTAPGLIPLAHLTVGATEASQAARASLLAEYENLVTGAAARLALLDSETLARLSLAQQMSIQEWETLARLSLALIQVEMDMVAAGQTLR